MNKPLFETDFPDLKLHSRGKVRDIYDLGDALLVVATDRVSAFDVIMPTPIPGKGKILTQMSEFWLDLLDNIIDNHLLTTDVNEMPLICHTYNDQLSERAMLVRKAKVLPIECIVRGYLVGSGWKDYQRDGYVCGIHLPDDLVLAQKLPKPIFTPSTKAPAGQHDQNIPFCELRKMIGDNLAKEVRGIAIDLYKDAARHALSRGIILADTKFEFGLIEGDIILIDEALTPDSSRFWPADQYEPGKNPPSFDKQFLRDYLLDSGWKQSDPPPELPPRVVNETRKKYLEALERLTGFAFEFD